MPNISRSFGGPVESLIGYVKASAQQSIQTDVAAPVGGKDEKNWLQQQLPGSKLFLFTSYGRHAWVTSPGLWMWLKKNEVNYDLIHIHGLFNPVSSFSATICRKKGFLYIIRPFGTLSRYTFSRTRWFKKPWFSLIDLTNLKEANGVHFTTNEEYEEANRLEISLKEKKVIIPPPYRSNFLDSGVPSEKFPDPVCLYMSRLHPKKNIEGLLYAWEKVLNAFPSARLIIAGSGDRAYTNSLQQLSQKLELQDSIEFTGFVTGEKKNRLLSNSWIFALPSHQENFGVAVLEAIACGLPVVISRDVQLANFVTASNTGMVVSKEATGIADAIIELFEDKEFRERCRVKGPESVRLNFSLEQIGQKLHGVYSEVSSQHIG